MTDRVREGSVPVAGAALYVREVGAGPPIIVLHGGPDFNHGYLVPDLDRLATAFRLIYYDQRGRGKSSEGVDPDDVTLESEIGDLDAVRRHCGLESSAVLGHSWGSLLAMEYAIAFHDRVTHLILLNTAPGSHADAVRFRAQRLANEPSALARMGEIAATRAYVDGDIAAEAQYYRIHFGKSLRRPDHLDRIVRGLRTHFRPADIVKARAIEDRLYAQTWRRPAYDLLPRLRELNRPALVVHGDEDLVPLGCARHIADALDGSRLVVLRNCGHFSYLEHPDAVYEAIVDFVSAPRAA